MALARDKVVKIQNVRGGVHFTEPYLEGEIDIDSKPWSGGSDNSSNQLVPVLLEDHGLQRFTESPEDIESEAGDVLPSLPDGWPRIPQLFQKRDFTTAMSPSINKVVSHLELLQNIVEEWFKEAESEIYSRASSSHSRKRTPALDSANGGKRQLRFRSPSVTSRARADSAQLSVQGIGAKTDSAQGHRIDYMGTEYEIPYLGAEEVLDEVITLLAKLETDRLDTLEKLATERERVTRLKDKIDSCAMKRLHELPGAVQKEHEACANDIAELKWHIMLRGRAEERIQYKAKKAQALNKKLKEDIEFVKGHIPLVSEKLELEKDAMARIKQAQLDTNDELNVTVTRCNNVEEKSREAFEKAEQERNLIKKDLDQVRSDLAQISEELAEAKMTHTSYIHQCNDYRQQLKDNEQELIVLQVKDENAKVAEEMQAVKVQDLQEKIKREEYEHRKLDAYNKKMEGEIEEINEKIESQEVNMKENIDTKEERLKLLTRKNNQLYMEIDDAVTAINDCERQKIADEKNLERMVKELERTKKQTAITMDELSNVNIINTAVREQLNNEEERCIQSEEQLRSTAEALKKQVKDEIHSRHVIAARMTSDGTEYVQYEEEAKEKKVRTEKKALEVKAAVQVVKDKVEKLRNKHKEKQDAIDKMRSEMERRRKELEEIEALTSKKKAELKPHHETLQTKVQAVTKKIEHMEKKTDMMHNKIEEMTSSATMMEKSTDKTEKEIAKLEGAVIIVTEELDKQTDSRQKLVDEAKAGLEDVKARINNTDMRHKDLMRGRTTYNNKQEVDLERCLKDNKVLASDYRRLQNEYVVAKHKLLDKYDERVTVENAIKDVKQLQSLQKRMHSAMLEYYKFRGLYNRSELNRMQKESNTNGVRVAGLQDDIDVALDKITEFLQQQMDGEAVKATALGKVLEQEEKERLREEEREKQARIEREKRSSEAASNSGPVVKMAPTFTGMSVKA